MIPSPKGIFINSVALKLALPIALLSIAGILSISFGYQGTSADDPWFYEVPESTEFLAESTDFNISLDFPVSRNTTFPGPNYLTNVNLTGGYALIPPDPIDAAGPNHIVCVINVVIEWYTKTGVQQNSELLQTFFSPLTPANFLFDPKVIYDQHQGRFLVVALERVDNGNPHPNSGCSSRILIAVSDDQDPNGVWYYHAINGMLNISGNNYWADYPGFAICEEAVYITMNMFRFSGDPSGYGGTRLWIVEKGIGSTGFYENGTANVTLHDPWTAAGGFQFTTQPAHVFGDPGTGIGTWLMGYSGFSSGGNEYVQIIQVNDPVGMVSFVNYQQVNVGNIDNTGTSPLPDAPQLDTSRMDIEVNDRRVLNAVWRNNSLWGSTTIVPSSGPDAGQTTAHWFKFDTQTPSAITVADQGNAGGEDIAPGTYTFFPAVMVDQEGNMAIGFAASGPTIHPGAYYAGRLASDPLGTVQGTHTLMAGVAGYQRRFSGTRNRWGDYTGMALDPLDERTFWVFNQYAWTQGNGVAPEDGRWATYCKSFNVGNNLPTANFTYSPSSPTILDVIQFADTSTDSDGSITGWLWEFGDGATSPLQHPIYTYSHVGTYIVNLTCWDNDGGNDTYSQNITVIEPVIDYILITHQTQNEVLNSTVSLNCSFTLYASAFNTTYGFLNFVNASWYLVNTEGSNASVNMSLGKSIKFTSGWHSGTAVLTADDGEGHNDSVLFSIDPSVFSTIFLEGWNLVTMPFDNEWSAESLGENITGCTVLTMFNGSSQVFMSHIVGVPWDNFPLEDGRGYHVYVTTDSIFTYQDIPLVGVTVPIYQDWNTIGWYPSYSTTAESLGGNISGCTLVVVFDAETQTFLTHIVGVPWDNFTIDRGRGIWIYTTEFSTWGGEG